MVASITQNNNLEYLIHYDYSSTNPYDSLDTPASEITYESTTEGLAIHMKPITIGKPWQIIKVHYVIFASNFKLDLHRYSRCAIPGNAIHK